MTERIDPLEQYEELKRPLLFSVLCHGGLFTAALSVSLWNAPISLGDPSGGSLGAPVSVNIVQGVPLPRPRSRLENPVANPVQHEVPAVPAPPAPAPEVAEDDPGAVPIETAGARKSAARQRPAPKRQNPPPTAPNQVGSSTGARLNSPLLTGQQTSGTGGVGFGSGSPFGARFGWYADALQRRLAEEWSRSLGQVSGSSARPAVVSFRITLAGLIENPQIAASSGNRSLDYSALRAVANSSPFRPLPREMGRSSIQVEITFQLQ